jgi:hypothetical protein
MKKFFKIFAALVLSAGMLAPQGLSAQQKRVIKVQGHPHELLTQKHGGREDATTKTRAVSGSTADINLADIKCWAGTPDTTLPIDSAVLLVKWTDGKRQSQGDSILAWGYHWNPDGSPKYTIDMIRAVANADCRFSVLLQNTGSLGYTAGGFGYNHTAPVNQRVPLVFDSTAASADTQVRFHYTGSPNCAMGQGAIPYSLSSQVDEAIRRSTGEDGTGTGTGIVRHPFDADYGYPAYDYDYWELPNPVFPLYRWQSGWYRNGYWAFYIKDQLNGNFDYSNVGISSREIGNHSVDGFVFALDMDFSKDMSGDYTAYGCNCGCNAPATVKNVTDKRK